MTKESVLDQVVALEQDVTHLIIEPYLTGRANYLVSEIEVRPYEQLQVLLGNFRKLPKGFSLHFSPQPEQDEVVARMVELVAGDGALAKLILHIGNYGDKTMTAQVWRL